MNTPNWHPNKHHHQQLLPILFWHRHHFQQEHPSFGLTSLFTITKVTTKRELVRFQSSSVYYSMISGGFVLSNLSFQTLHAFFHTTPHTHKHTPSLHYNRRPPPPFEDRALLATSTMLFIFLFNNQSIFSIIKYVSVG